MALVNKYNEVEGLVVRTDKVLSDMTVDAGERTTLVNLVAENFQGAAGTDNYDLQQRVGRLIDEYNTQLTALKGATKEVSGIDGMFRAVDVGQGMRFQQIGT
ncbi:hypothetical protein OHB12_31995 [Nocardia sp. NBC_01730]|uniref:hypothetical protein n=1 Tax=Nocardia sp. NBC_01730 TaxID=2975998 RepID=UPI002E120059|nr:hypothetical protein OHB12_31995 [Nocardia sp. NBC_01730]